MKMLLWAVARGEAMRQESKGASVVERHAAFEKGETAAKISIASMAFLALIKGLTAILTGSVALLADALNSFSDILASIMVWLGMRLMRREPSKRFPYGYFRAETLASLAVSIMIFASGFEILWESVRRLYTPKVISYPLLALAAAAASAAVLLLLARYKRRIGTEIGSRSLTSDSQHSMVDVYSSLLVFVGVLVSHYWHPLVEAAVALIVGAYVIKTGVWFAKDAALVLMDACLSPEKAETVKKIAAEVPGVEGVHGLKLRRSGPVVFGEMHVEVKDEMPMEKAHEITDTIEERVKEAVNDIESLTVHMEPAKKAVLRVALSIGVDRGLQSTAEVHFARAPLFYLVDIREDEIIHSESAVNPGASVERGRGITAAHFLVDHQVDAVIAGGLGEGPFHVLRDHLVKIYKLPRRIDVATAVQMLSRQQLEKMTSPTERRAR